MATNPNPSNDAALQAALAQAVKEIQGQGAASPESTPIKLKIGETDVQFDSAEKASQQLTQLVAQYQQNLNAVQEQLRQTTAQLQQSQSAPEGLPGRTADVSDKEPPKFDMQRFAKDFLEDPAKALDYADLFRPKIAEMEETIKEMQAKLGTHDRVTAANQFVAMHKDFPNTPPAAQALAQLMDQFDLPWTVQGLTAGWAVMRQTQAAMQAQAQAAQQTTNSPASGPITPNPAINLPFQSPAPPVVPRGGATPSFDMNEVENMNSGQIAELIRRLQSTK